MRLGILATHPIQYQVPLFRKLASLIDVEVFFAHRATSFDQARAGFGVTFDWDIPLLDGYSYRFLENRPSSWIPGNFLRYNTPEIADFIKKSAFDAFLVAGWYNLSYWQSILSCWASHTPVMVRGDSQLMMNRSFWKKAGKSIFYKSFIPRFDACLTVGQRSRDYYLAYGARPERLFFSPHFVDNDFFQGAAQKWLPKKLQLKQQYGVDQAAPVSLFVGKFIDKKRPLDFVRSVVRASRTIPGLVGLMVGDGPLRPDIEIEIERQNAPVRLVGFLNQTKIPEAYVVADVLVLPSDGRETWGLVVNEAMACGVPAIVSDQVGCQPDLIENGLTGYSFPIGDILAMAEGIEKVVSRHDKQSVKTALANKMKMYSVDTAVQGVLKAMDFFSYNFNQN